MSAQRTVASCPQDTAPAKAGLRDLDIHGIDTLIADAMAAGEMPGCVVCIGRQGKIAFLKAYGLRQVEPFEEPMTTDTVFDLASLTKPIATGTAIILLVERGQLRLEDNAADYLPGFGVKGKEAITVRQLLIHQSGLLPDNALRDYLDGPERAIERICELELQNPVGEKFVYSDVNFIVLGELVRRISGKPLDEFTRDEVFAPLGMTATGFRPDEQLRRRAAPTEQREGEWMKGEVHDPRAFELGGVAGHAGLFSTAEDLAVYSQMMLNRGEYGGQRILKSETIERMTRGDQVSVGLRGLGWDKQSGYSYNGGERKSKAAFGHGGFTGTVLWIDPERDLFFIFLSNRLHPDGKGAVNRLAGMIADLAIDSLNSAVDVD
ncbi:MAG: beta-lactamase family protein [Planctomycetaceae bacterium]|nr:beta-lactamase family protein [Planctomycetaceae bacterium]